jgi:hypothetical protein
MSTILSAQDREWSTVATSHKARRAVIRWAHRHEVLAGLSNLHEVLERRRDRTLAPGVLHALAEMAPGDDLAARCLLQALIPGLVCLAARSGNDDPGALDEMVSLAWERIRTYPRTRHGSVAGNVLLDVRKRYRAHRVIDAPTGAWQADDNAIDLRPGPDDEVLGRLLLEDLAAAQRNGVVSAPALELIVRTRVVGESLADVAEAEAVEPQVLCQRRWRAERRLRQLPLTG